MAARSVAKVFVTRTPRTQAWMRHVTALAERQTPRRSMRPISAKYRAFNQA
jgi:hypothetical protein